MDGTTTAAPLRPGGSRKTRLAVGFGLSGIVCVATTLIIWSKLSTPTDLPKGSSRLLPMSQPGIRQPPTVSAIASGLNDDAQIIGVTVGGRSRAYLVSAFAPLPGGRYATHVVNDLLAGIPVTITHCDRTDCTRVFTGHAAGKPLDIAVGGWGGAKGAGLLLLVGSVRYPQATDQPLHKGEAGFPYAERAYTRLTWKQWRDAHPATDVYVGVEPPAESILR